MASLFFVFLLLSLFLALHCLAAPWSRDFIIAWREPLGNEFGPGYQAFEPVCLVVSVVAAVLFFREWRYLRGLEAPRDKRRRKIGR